MLEWARLFSKALMRSAALADLDLLLPVVRAALSILRLTARHAAERRFLAAVTAMLRELEAAVRHRGG